jgi:phosphoglycolate phosphatase-like HAD superfamily hydrolase
MVGWVYDSGAALELDLVILIKDGVLLDVPATWYPGYKEAARRVAQEAGEGGLEPQLLKISGWVEGADCSPQIAQGGLLLRGRHLAQAWIDTQPIVAAHFERDSVRLSAMIEPILSKALVRDATPLGSVDASLRALRSAGLRLALVCDDQEALAKAQIDSLGWSSLFEVIVGADSHAAATAAVGGGHQPPDGVRHAMQLASTQPSLTVLVGDSEADMIAGRSAGCAFTIAVHPDDKPLPAGLATAACRMPNIGSLPAALGAAGVTSLRSSSGGTSATVPVELPPAGTAAGQGAAAAQAQAAHAAADEEAAAAAAAAAVDPDVIALVQGARWQRCGR